MISNWSALVSLLSRGSVALISSDLCWTEGRWSFHVLLSVGIRDYLMGLNNNKLMIPHRNDRFHPTIWGAPIATNTLPIATDDLPTATDTPILMMSPALWLVHSAETLRYSFAHQSSLQNSSSQHSSSKRICFSLFPNFLSNPFTCLFSSLRGP